MIYGLQLVTPPAAEPVTLAQAKAHLRVDFPDEDALISALISAAREHVESKINRAIYDQSWILTLDQFPSAFECTTVSPQVRDNYWANGAYYSAVQIKLPMPRLVLIQSISYADADGNMLTLSPELYTVDINTEPARLVPVNGASWPYPTQYIPGSVQITYTTGSYGDGVNVDSCPLAIKQAILLLVGHLYANREAVTLAGMPTALPLAFDALLQPYRCYGVI